MKARRSGRSWPLMREAEARGLKVGAVLPQLVHARKFDDATDPAAVLHGRVQRWAAAAASKRSGGGRPGGRPPPPSRGRC